MIAGLEQPSAGEIFIDTERVDPLPPRERDIAFVFQNYALYPHMTVFDNIAFALRLRAVPPNQIESKVRDAARLLEIENLLERRPHGLWHWDAPLSDSRKFSYSMSRYRI